MATEIVTGWKEIGHVFGVRPVDVRKWYEDGAPILLLQAKKEVPCTSVPDLWAWLKEQFG